MFERLRQIAQNAVRLDINEILSDIWRDTFVQDFILEELNQNDQLRKGLKANGKEVGFYRNDGYADFKQAIGSKAPTGTVDLVVTGDFYSTFAVDITPKGFQITANTGIYEFDFAQKYGEEILGLSEESIQKLQEFVKPMIIEKVREHLIR